MTESPTRTVDRALSLLGIVCDRGTVSLADAARDAELSPSTALRLLRTLESQGFVRRDTEGRYTPGARIVQLGALALANESLVTLADPAMRRMVEATGESCYLSVRGVGETALYIAIVEGTHSVRHASWVGRSIPFEGSAVGAVLGGADGPGGPGRWGAADGPPGSGTPDGYVVVKHGVEDDVTAIAAPIVVGGRVVAALSSVVPSYRVGEERTAEIGGLLTREAASVIADPTHRRRPRSDDLTRAGHTPEPAAPHHHEGTTP